jgi:hypothetical protein
VEIGAAGLTFSDGSTQTVAWTGSMSYNDLNDLPTLFDGSYNSLSDVPASFEPSSHAHGSISNDGKIGDTSGLLVVTTTDGVLTTSTTVDVSQVYSADGNWFLNAPHLIDFLGQLANNEFSDAIDSVGGVPWSTITNTPTTLSGYGITDGGGGGGIDPTQPLTCSKLTVVANGGAQTANGDSNACFVLDNGSNATNAWFNFSGNDSDDPGTNCTLGFTGDGNFFHGITYVIADNRLTISPDGANGNPQNGLTVDAAGNVGIGTVAPTQTLEVAGAVKCEKLVLGEVAVDGGGDAGEIRFYGGHFYGYDGSDWIQLDN